MRLRVGGRTPACARDGLTAGQARRGLPGSATVVSTGNAGLPTTCVTCKEDNVIEVPDMMSREWRACRRFA